MNDDAKNDEWHEKYARHLASPEWQEIRQQVLWRCHGFCEGCNRAGVEHVHHLTYSTYNLVGRELLFELVGLCEDCHSTVHGKVPEVAPNACGVEPAPLIKPVDPVFAALRQAILDAEKAGDEVEVRALLAEHCRRARARILAHQKVGG